MRQLLFVLALGVLFVSTFVGTVKLLLIINIKAYFPLSNEEVSAATLLEPTATITPEPSPTIEPSPTQLPTPTPTIIPKPTSIPQPDFTSEEINTFIDRFAGQYSLDPHVLRHVAVCESGFKSKAVNGNYVGLFQFGVSAWVSARSEMGEDASLDLRYNAEEAIQTAAFLLHKDKDNLWPNCVP